MKKHFILLFLTLLLSACGFHLRGAVDMPQWLNNVAIIAKDSDKQLISVLQAQLEGYKIHVNPEATLAQYWIIINKVNLQQQIVSVGASTNPRQYNLVLTIEFLLQTRKGQILKTATTVSATRQLTINNDRILGSTYEESLLIGEMKQDAAVQIINRLSVVTPASPLSH